MSNKLYGLELDVNDMETNIYMRLTRAEMESLVQGMQVLLDIPRSVEDHKTYQQTVIDDSKGDMVTVRLHKWKETTDND